jgi:divalent metal cation (Fe/Co/Zn/Cd) transporter
VALIRSGRRHRSIALEADGKHLMTDVWTSVGVIIGVGAVALTGWRLLDPVIALASPRTSSSPASPSCGAPAAA